MRWLNLFQHLWLMHIFDWCSCLWSSERNYLCCPFTSIWRYLTTKPLPNWQRSIPLPNWQRSISGKLSRLVLRNLSNNKPYSIGPYSIGPYSIGSTSVIPKQYAIKEPDADPRPVPSWMSWISAHSVKSDTVRKYPEYFVSEITVSSLINLL